MSHPEQNPWEGRRNFLSRIRVSWAIDSTYRHARCAKDETIAAQRAYLTADYEGFTGECDDMVRKVVDHGLHKLRSCAEKELLEPEVVERIAESAYVVASSDSFRNLSADQIQDIRQHACTTWRRVRRYRSADLQSDVASAFTQITGNAPEVPIYAKAASDYAQAVHWPLSIPCLGSMAINRS